VRAGYYRSQPETRRRALRRLPVLASLVALAAAGCAAPGAGIPASGADCVLLFQQYDAINASMSTQSGRNDRMAIPPPLQFPVQRLQNAGCMTLSADLAGLATAGGPPITDSGAPIAPVGLHAGVVTNMADEAAVLDFFAANGVRARSVGAAGLGRRIYLGPFQTQGALDAARDLAVRAGFASPYPANF
jgi:hypothetical protein